MKKNNNLVHSFFKKSNQYPYNYIIAISAIVGGYTALILMDYQLNHEYKTLCPFKLISGLPCPGCGMGRASLALFNRDLTQSLLYNILCIPLTIFVAISLIWLIKDLITRKDSFFSFIKRPISKKYKIILFTIIIVNWIINIYHQV